jgi:hypothetical protein
MAACAYCQSTILLGGKRVGDDRFCNDRCLASGTLLARSAAIPEETVRNFVQSIHMGPCPKCQGRGPLDVYTSYFVWSALVMTSFKTQPAISCRSCGLKRQMGSIVGSLLVGWWGIPWGIVMTPVQVTRNIVDACRKRDPLRPSRELERLARITLAGRQAGRS